VKTARTAHTYNDVILLPKVVLFGFKFLASTKISAANGNKKNKIMLSKADLFCLFFGVQKVN
jgi:hypothetical protein